MDLDQSMPTSSAKKRRVKSRTDLKDPHEVEEIEDDGILMIKIGKKGNEFKKPGYKKYDPNKTSYTTKVLDRLDKIQNPKKPKSKAKKKQQPPYINPKELEGMKLKGMEVIKDLDKYYEDNKEMIKEKVFVPF